MGVTVDWKKCSEVHATDCKAIWPTMDMVLGNSGRSQAM